MAKRWNGKVKIITGIRRCGKSFLLSNIYKQALMNEGAGDFLAQEYRWFYRKIVVLDGSSLPCADEDGVIYTGIIPFLLGGVMEELVEEG